MSGVSAEAIETGQVFRSRTFLREVSYSADRLVVTLISPDDGTVASATFSEVLGFRVLDEGDLLEFWPACAANNGWLFRIRGGGWLEQETTRPGFVKEMSLPFNEYFIASQNECISVLAGAAPRVEIRSS